MFVGLLLAACVKSPAPATVVPDPPRPSQLDELEALSAFARLYGVVRWFHPADEAAGVPWDSIAVDGVAVARAARTPDELRDGLSELLAPLAPTLQLWRDDEPAPPPLVHPGDGPRIAWQHLGFGQAADPGVFGSLRVGREDPPTGTLLEVTAMAGASSPELQGRTVRVSARLRVETDGTGGGRLFLITDRGPPWNPITEVGGDLPLVVDPEWRRYELTHTVEPDSRWVHFGFTLTGRSRMWADDLRWDVLEADGTWRPLAVREPGFDQRGEWWAFDGLGYDVEILLEHGDPVLSLAHHDLALRQLFEEVPALGEATELPIGAGLVARVPLALPAGEAPAPPASAPWTPTSDRDDPDVRVAAALVAWNVLRHFDPEPSERDWDALLRETLADATRATDREGVIEGLWRLRVAVPDGQAWVGHPQVTGGLCGAPFRVGRAADAVVVTSSADPAVGVGDRVVAVDGVEVSRALATARAHVSGSDHFRDASAAERLAVGPCDRTLALDLDRSGAPTRAEVRRVRRSPPLFEHPPVEVLDGGVVAVDLAQLSWEELKGDLDLLVHAPGLVFDLREAPGPGITHLLSHLLTSPDERRGWRRIPEIVRPGEISAWTEDEWALLPEAPRLEGRVAFLASPLSRGAAESALAMVRTERLGTTVGGPTAGADGDLALAPLPGGYALQFTGARVVQPDGSPLHGVGLVPDVPVEPTAEGLRAGRDEVRDAALAWVARQPR